MTTQEVFWSEGMFLRPQHFQAAHRHTLHLMNRGEGWDHRHNWGLRAFRIDEDALRDYRFRVLRLQARLPESGVLISVDDDGPLSEVDLRPHLLGRRGQKEACTVRLFVPKLNSGGKNVPLDGHDDTVRYRLDQKEVNDENTGDNPYPIDFRSLNFTLGVGDGKREGYEDLCLARVTFSGRPDAAPELDPTYIPPLIGCEAWEPLRVNILQSIYARLGKMREPLLQQASGRRALSFDGTALGDLQTLLLLWVLNEAYSVLDIMAFADGVHPFQAYLELCRLVGRLAVFTRGRRSPGLPKYDHDDLFTCFNAILQFLDRFQEALPKPRVHERPFVGNGFQMQVTLEREWLDTDNWLVFIGVDSDLPPQDCQALLTRGGQVNMKLASRDHAEEVFYKGKGDLKFDPVAPLDRPPDLPEGTNVFYLKVNPQSQPSEWEHVRKTCYLALRVNEANIVGRLDGQDKMTLKYGKNPTIRFTLFVVPKSAEKKEG